MGSPGIVFCRQAAAVAALAASSLGREAAAQTASSHPPLVIGVLSYETGESTATDSISRNAERGLLLGIEEARETARLFGREVTLRRAVISRGGDASLAAAALAGAGKLSALLVTNPQLIPVAESLPHRGYKMLVMRTIAGGALDCSRLVFAVYPPKSALGTAASPRGQPTLWAGSLQRFGARELNDRFRTRWKTEMTSEAWASWVAVKILSEAALRAQSTAALSLADYISRSEFDGHKGWPLTFRAADHILRQPIYIVSAADGKTLTELPAGGRSDTEPAEAMLDRVLPARANPACGRR